MIFKGDANPYRFRHLLGRAHRQAAGATQESRQYAIEYLNDSNEIMAIDKTGLLKKGEQSVGVQVYIAARQVT